MKDLIERLRSFDSDYDMHYLDEAADALEQQAAVIEQILAAFVIAVGDKSPFAKQVLALQPCPEVLAKVKADARREGMLAAAEICDKSDKNTHPADLADAIREAAKS
jgi:hypothetical protein